MTQISPTPAAPVTDAYRPVSLLAIIGLALGLASNAVFFFDNIGALLLLSLPALFVSILAKHRVRKSEGTLAGGTVATAGIILSLISSLGWYTSHLTQQWVLSRESRRFLENEWFVKLQQNKIADAFLDAVEPQYRIQPKDLQQLRNHYAARGESRYDEFRTNPLIQMLLRQGSQVQWQHRRLEDWSYSLGTYTVKHRYHVTSPELEGEVLLTVKSTKAKDAKSSARVWQYEGWDDAGIQFTAYGQELGRAIAQARDRLQTWVRHVSSSEWDEALAITELSPEQKPREVAVLRFGTLAMVPTLSAAQAPVLSAVALSTPGPSSPHLSRLNDACVSLRGVKPSTAVPGPDPLRLVLLKARRQGADWELDFEFILERTETTSLMIVTGKEYQLKVSFQGGGGESGASRWRITKYSYETLGDVKRMPQRM